MNDVCLGIWKTFNVMTLTALGSGPLALGIAAWVFNRQKLHVVMRTALVQVSVLRHRPDRSWLRCWPPVEFLQRRNAMAMEQRVGDARNLHLHAALLRGLSLL